MIHQGQGLVLERRVGQSGDGAAWPAIEVLNGSRIRSSASTTSAGA